MKIQVTRHDGSEQIVDTTQSDGVDFELHFDMPFVKATMETVESAGVQVPVMRLVHLFFLAYAAERRGAGYPADFASFDAWRAEVAAVSLVGEPEVDEAKVPGPLDSAPAA